jgi:hypothetical protein
MTYQLRQTFDEMLKLSPNENIIQIKEIFENLSDQHFTFFQWSSSSQRANKPGEYERFKSEHPGIKDLPSIKRARLLVEWNKSQPNWFFMEAFGPQFIRSEAETFLECAEIIRDKWNKRMNCPSHNWEYTHSNGHKTCSKCGYFADCTVEEALLHYKKGYVEINDHLSLHFDHEKELCKCGSRQVHFYPDSMFYENFWRCVSCNELVNSPEQALGEKMDFDYQCNHLVIFMKGKKTKEEMVKQRASLFLEKMWKHFKYVEKRDSYFIKWVESYFTRFVQIWDAYIDINGITHHLQDAFIVNHTIEDDKVTSLTLNLKLKAADSSVQTDDDYAFETMKNFMDALVEEEN